MNVWRAQEGSPFPLGVAWLPAEQTYNFAVYSRTALTLVLNLYTPDNLLHPIFCFTFDPLVNKTDDIWHCRVSDAQADGAAYYSLHATSDPAVTGQDTLFHSGKELLDPYAKEIFFPPNYALSSGIGPGNNAGHAALGILPARSAQPFDWGGITPPLRGPDLVIYEMHVRGFTANPSSGDEA